MDQVRIDRHTLSRAVERGTNEAEILDVLATGTSVPARQGRLARTKVYPFARVWRGRVYPQKRVEVYYVVAPEGVVTVTVYVFYGRWGALE